MSLPNDHSSADQEFSAEARRILMAVARRSISSGVDTGHAFVPDPTDYMEKLREKRACFVTLLSRELLRGCMGTLEQNNPLVLAVAQTAFSAAFHDPRMPSVNREELDELDVNISVLSDLVRMNYEDEQDLLSQIRPGIDGLLLRVGYKSGTLLPSVWKTIPDPADFLQALKRKAGLNPFYWSDDISVEYYTTESFSA